MVLIKKMDEDKYSTIILVHFFKTKTFFYFVASKVWPLEGLPEIFIFPIPSSLSYILGVEKLIPFILLVLYYHSQAPPLPLQSLQFIFVGIAALLVLLSWRA